MIFRNENEGNKKLKTMIGLALNIVAFVIILVTVIAILAVVVLIASAIWRSIYSEDRQLGYHPKK